MKVCPIISLLSHESETLLDNTNYEVMPPQEVVFPFCTAKRIAITLSHIYIFLLRSNTKSLAVKRDRPFFLHKYCTQIIARGIVLTTNDFLKSGMASTGGWVITSLSCLKVVAASSFHPKLSLRS